MASIYKVAKVLYVDGLLDIEEEQQIKESLNKGEVAIIYQQDPLRWNCANAVVLHSVYDTTGIYDINTGEIIK